MVTTLNHELHTATLHSVTHILIIIIIIIIIIVIITLMVQLCNVILYYFKKNYQ